MKISIGANTILYPTPVLIVGTYDVDEKPNLMTVAWGGICCSDPPCVAIAVRKATYTYGNICAQKAFTVSIPSEKHARCADYFGIASGKNANKFDVSGLTPVKSSLVNAPYVEEFPIALECKLIHQIEIGLHTQFIGEILDIKADKSVLGEKGMPDIEKVRPFSYDPGAYAYYKTGEFLGAAFSIGKDLKKKA